MPDLTRADFPAFFAALNGGSEPYPWQRDLVARLARGEWPDQVVAPTGAGKSVFIEAHVFLRALAVASGTSAGGVPYPRRLALSVGRRALVDAQADRARTVAEQISKAEDGVLHRVREVLLAHTGRTDFPPVSVSVMRGGMAVDTDWLVDPIGCHILCITPDLLGSRLLFRAYVASWKAAPRHAGLLAYDTLAVIDEAHLNTQLVTTLRRIGAMAETSPLAEHVPALRVVETTATPASASAHRLEVVGSSSPGDALDTRMRARKTLSLHQAPSWPLPQRGPARAGGIAEILSCVDSIRAGASGTVGVMVNRVRDAVEIARALEARSDPPRVAVLVGPMRPADRTALETRHPGLLTPQGCDDVDVLVTTQTVEVGVDIDLHGLVTEIAPAASLVQRFGRVNRRGRIPDAPATVIVPTGGAPTGPSGPYEAQDITSACAWLAELGPGADLSPASLAAPDGPALPATAPRRLLPSRIELSEAQLLAQTSEDLFTDPELDLWLSDDLSTEQPTVFIVGRRLPDDLLAARELVSLVKPLAPEMFPVPLSRARALVDAAPRPVVVMRRGEVLADQAFTLQGGDVVVLPAQYPAALFGVLQDADVTGRRALGDVYEHPADPEGDEPLRVIVASSHPPQNGTQQDSLQLLSALPASIARVEEARALEDEELDRPITAAEVREALSAGGRALFDTLAGSGLGDLSAVTVSYPSTEDEQGFFPWFVLHPPTAPDAASEAIQEYGIGARVLLTDHQNAVGRRAEAFAATVGLPSGICKALDEAGKHHDDGKAARAFQALLGAKPGGPLLAKSGDPRVLSPRLRSRTSLPRQWRHEQLSVALAWPALSTHDPSTRALIARLIGTSHGWGRTAFPHTSADLVVPDQALAAEPAEDLFDVGQWDELMASTTDVWGPWGAAYLEALFRAADGAVSKEGS